MKALNWIKWTWALLRFGPHLLLFHWHPQKATLSADIARWISIYHAPRHAQAPWRQLLHLLTYHPEFRNVFAYRLGPAGRLVCAWGAKESTLFLVTDKIGPGLFIHHGFATIVMARSIGRNCWINQQVTIGYAHGKGCPTIGDNVTISAGAKVLGGVTIGDDVVIGANAVVTRDVPSGATVVGAPARVIKIHGHRV